MRRSAVRHQRQRKIIDEVREARTDSLLRLRSYLTGKTVSLVGGYSADDYVIPSDVEVVVRTNGHWLRQKGQCDILFHNCCSLRELDKIWKHPNINQVRALIGNSTKPRAIRQMRNIAKKYGAIVDCFPYAIGASVPHKVREYDWLQKIVQRYNFRPYTGLMSLAYMLRFPIKKVYLQNMTLYAGTPDERAKKKRHCHELSAQAKYLLDLREEDSRVAYDPLLSNVLENYQDDA